MNSKRLRHAIVYLLFVLSVGIIIFAALSRRSSGQPDCCESSGSIPDSAESISPIRLGLAGAVIVATIAAFQIIQRRYGTALTVKVTASKQPTTTSGRRFRVGFVYLLFVLAVGAIIMAALARNPSPASESPEYTPPPQSTRSVGIPLIVMLGIPGLGIVASVAALAIGRNGIMPINERLLNPYILDVHVQDVTPTATVKTIIDALSAEGYIRLGELVRHSANAPDTVTWLMSSEDRQITAVLVVPH